MVRKRASPAKTKIPKPITTRNPATRTAARSTAKPASGTTRFVVVAILLFLVLVLIFIFVVYPSPAPTFISQGSDGFPSCIHGDTRPCSVGSCDGAAICINGIWSGCRWEDVCVPGSRTACTQFSCTYGMKECNECGTGYGPCGAP